MPLMSETSRPGMAEGGSRLRALRPFSMPFVRIELLRTDGCIGGTL